MILESKEMLINKRYEKTIILKYRTSNGNYFDTGKEEIEYDKEEPKKFNYEYIKKIKKIIDIFNDNLKISLNKIFSFKDQKKKENEKKNDQFRFKILIKYTFILYYDNNWKNVLDSRENRANLEQIIKNKEKKDKHFRFNKEFIEFADEVIKFEREYRDYLLENNFATANYFNKEFLLKFYDLKIKLNEINTKYWEFLSLFSAEEQKKFRNCHNEYPQINMTLEINHEIIE